MEVSIEVDKIIKCALHNTVFSLQVEVLLVLVTLIKQIIKDVNLMCISFSAKHSQMFWEL